MAYTRSVEAILLAFLILAGSGGGLKASAGNPAIAPLRFRTEHQQTVHDTTSKLRIAVLIDLDNKAEGRFRGKALARIATETLADELARADLYQIMNHERVDVAIRDLGLHPPLSREERKKLGDRLNADVVVTGEVAFVRLDAEAVHAGLMVRVFDVQAEELINGAAQISKMERTANTRKDALVEAAIKDVATRAVKQIRDYILPEGGFLSSDARLRTLVIDRGSQDHIRDGMELVVLRDGKRVSKVRVTKVNPTTAECQVTLYGADVKRTDTWRAFIIEGYHPRVYRRGSPPHIRI